MLTKSTTSKALLPPIALLSAAGLGVLVGVAARGSGEVGWLFALLVCSAVVAAIAQQTLP